MSVASALGFALRSSPDTPDHVREEASATSAHWRHVVPHDAMALGKVVLELGGGRLNLGDDIDPGVGFVLDAHVGSLMIVDEPWITVYHRGELAPNHRKMIEDSIQLSNEPVDAESRVIEIL